MFDVPVVLMIYNRPELTRQVFSAIRMIRPATLFIIADGPKNEADAVLCAAARQAVTAVDWPCQVHRLYAAENMGVARRPLTGLNQVFQQVEAAIILEDDTLPDLSFFEFCRELLNHYKHDPSILLIGGTNLCGHIDIQAAYGTSRFYLPPWGWASWRRSWQQYDFTMHDWAQFKSKWALQVPETFAFWETFLDRYSQKLSSWDVQLCYTLWRTKTKAIIPKQNLVRNLGYHAQATFTKLSKSFVLDLPLQSCTLPLEHPLAKTPDLDTLIEPKVIRFLEEIMQFNQRSGIVLNH
ncbi:MAG TPA: hypothetical protein PKC76_09720 [Saprospiraceae bacterium]|nr:hypothetical protein [Saprospiraceae bacterium]HMP24399.1 hypothetical protein [Saprospiraceae bacterium]